MAKTHLKDESGDRSYFVVTPRLVWALARNPFDYTLWGVIKDVAGETGECFLDRVELAALSMMSPGQVTASLKHWMSVKLIAGEKRKDAGHLHPCWHLTIPDIWVRNVIWSKKNLKIAARLDWKRSQRDILKGEIFETLAPAGEGDWSPPDLLLAEDGSHSDQSMPDGGGDWSGGDPDWSGGGVKEEPQRKTTKTKEKPPGGKAPPAETTSAGDPPSPPASNTPGPAPAPKKSRPRDPLFDSIAILCGVDPATAGSSIAKVAAILKKAGYTVADVEAFGVSWWADPWRAKRGEPPSLWTLKEKIGLIRRGANDKPHQQSTQSNLPTDGERERDDRLRAERERVAAGR